MRSALLIAAGAVSGLLAGCAVDQGGARAKMVATMRSDAADAPMLAQDPIFRATLDVIARLPRERFVPKAAVPAVYLGTPLEIGWRQTISDPYIVAVMTAAAKVHSGARVLEIGTGSGYQAAVLAKLGASVSTIEIVPELAARAAGTLKRLRIGGVDVRAGDGFAGWPDRAPFDAIIVTAGGAKVPAPLLAQVRVGGRLIMPIGPSTPSEQLLVYERRSDGTFAVCTLGRAMFVPLTGQGQIPERPAILDRSFSYCYGVSVS